MKVIALASALAVLACSEASAQTALKPELTGLAFLVGHWTSGNGKVADTGGTSQGDSTITIEAGGSVLLRRDHTNLFDKAGKPSGAFDQIMMIYPEDGKLRADYSDGTHVIHYTSAVVTPGHSVTFTSTAAAAAPTFQLTYTTPTPSTLAVTFQRGGIRFSLLRGSNPTVMHDC